MVASPFGRVNMVRIVVELRADRHVHIPIHNRRRAGVCFTVVPIGNTAFTDCQCGGGGHRNNFNHAYINGN